jgi:TonB family protein
MEESMQSSNHSISARRFAMVLFNTAVLALALSVALPAYADGRAVKSRVNPVYPEIARRMKVGGLVKLEATVGADGKVVTVKTVSGNRMLSNAAEDAVKQWKFAPGTEQTSEEIDVNFAVSQ